MVIQSKEGIGELETRQRLVASTKTQQEKTKKKIREG
jgi:hypothetical protein